MDSCRNAQGSVWHAASAALWLLDDVPVPTWPRRCCWITFLDRCAVSYGTSAQRNRDAPWVRTNLGVEEQRALHDKHAAESPAWSSRVHVAQCAAHLIAFRRRRSSCPNVAASPSLGFDEWC